MERDLFLVFFYASGGGRERGKKWTPLEGIDKRGERAREKKKSRAHRLGTSPPPSIIAHMEGKKAAAAGPRFPFAFQRAAPRCAWDDLLAWRTPLFPCWGESHKGAGEGGRVFSACRAATSPETAGSPPEYGWDDGLLQGCNLGCHDAEMLQPLLS